MNRQTTVNEPPYPITMEASIRMPPGEFAHANRLLGHNARVEDEPRDETIFSRTAHFVNGCEADFKVVNSSGEDCGPWAEVVLFDPEGHEIGCSDVFDACEAGDEFTFDALNMRFLVRFTQSETA